jgi:hypothetical protein
MRTIVPVYNTHRMVTEYATKYYFPQGKGHGAKGRERA